MWSKYDQGLYKKNNIQVWWQRIKFLLQGTQAQKNNHDGSKKTLTKDVIVDAWKEQKMVLNVWKATKLGRLRLDQFVKLGSGPAY